MIPKVIHYCWFGGKPLSKEALKCIESWRKYCPDYEIKQWDESNVDFSDCNYAIEAYNEKKWAFVSDYVRFKILYEHGGLYFDTDVELVKSIDHIVAKGAFMGCQNSCDIHNDCGVNPGLGLAVAPGHDLYRELLDLYRTLHFEKTDDSNKYKTVVEYTTELLQEHGLKNANEIQFVDGVYIYPKEYFQPMDLSTGNIHVTKNTVSIHHFSGSWCDKKNLFRGRVYRFLNRFLGKKIANLIRKIFGKQKV